MFPPQRVVCLTEETVELLYLMGEQDRIVGISGYVVRPPQARKEKPKVSAFTSANVDKILALQPDLVLAFSDIQADIVHALIKHGLDVHTFNQRTLQEVYDAMRMTGALVGATERAGRLVDELAAGVEATRERAATLPRKPRVYFEEWDEPGITAIGWVSDLIAAAGGTNVFADRAAGRAARDRFVTHAEIIAAAPDLIIGSWCGKRFRPDHVVARPGYETVPAVRDGAVYEIKSPLILQPGPAALTEGLAALEGYIRRWAVE
ncbi:MAG: Cobalamin-binding protein [Cyanobacteria bacterium RYN_339]|nr:Cobalamin-binding protein [Cyanobacteria bacterium RYN_339]